MDFVMIRYLFLFALPLHYRLVNTQGVSRNRYGGNGEEGVNTGGVFYQTRKL